MNGEYGDIMEQAFYNTVLAGIQLDGKGFFYVNPLEAIPGISGIAPTHRHTLIRRPKWYACACCPPNAARLISSIGQYAYAEKEDTVYCHLYASGEVAFKNGIVLECKTGYPYDFEINYKVSGSCTLAVRVPHWSRKTTFTVNGKTISPEIKSGYAYIPMSEGDELKLVLDGAPRFVYPSEKIHSLSGKAAVCMGPLVYCFEGADNGETVISSSIDTSEKITVGEFDPELLGGTRKLTVKGIRREAGEVLYLSAPPKKVPCELYAIPYSLWANRSEGQMRVWMDIV